MKKKIKMILEHYFEVYEHEQTLNNKYFNLYRPEVLAHWNFYYWSTVLEDPKSNIANEVIEYENGKLICTFNFKGHAQIHVPEPADNGWCSC